LGSGDFERLRPHLEPVTLSLRQTLAKAGVSIEHANYPDCGMISLVSPLDGLMVEVGVVGREGFAGTPILLGVDASPLEMMVQVAGTGSRIRADALRGEVGQSPALLRLLLRYTQAFHSQVSQSAACNGRHTLQERLARWLLMARDRTESDELPLSHEFLSMMLGVRRAGVTVAVGTLKAAGLIRSSHGHITILDRDGMEAAACECYRVVKREYERLLP
jgi:CRP-like cAMP-binding protein